MESFTTDERVRGFISANGEPYWTNLAGTVIEAAVLSRLEVEWGKIKAVARLSQALRDRPSHDYG